jgi:Major Facilitator Superfamily
VTESASHRPPDEEPLARIAVRRALRRLRADATTPEFGRLLSYQAFGAAGDALVAIALAGSLFFSVPPTQARDRVALYLLLTMAPFAIVAPLLATFLDRRRGGMRAALVVAAIGRALFAWLMSTRIDSLLLFPIAFGLLIFSRASQVVRGALLPQLVPDEHSLVNANASLSRTSALAGIGASLPGIALLRWPGVQIELWLAVVVYAAGAIPALRLPKVHGKREDEERIGARKWARSVTIRQAVVAAAGIRFLVGFLVFHLAFALRREDFGSIGLGLLVGAAAAGGLFGALLAPRLRRRLREEGILVTALVLAGASGLLVGWWFSAVTATVLVFAFGVTSGIAKVAFDAIVQRETPEGARGWAFARYESGLQLAWVLGAFVPLLPTIPAGPGVFAAGVAANLLAILFMLGRHRVSSGVMP